MIIRHPQEGQKLDVAGLNEITVLIDRSETALTEVAINAWTPGLDGPPHAHERKEQNFLVLDGHGEVHIGGRKFEAAAGDFFYVPAGVVHQTISRDPVMGLRYFLFNAFLDADKEGHASFAEHIDKVRETRRAQAAQQSAGKASATASSKPCKHAAFPKRENASATILINRDESERCEALAWRLAPNTSVNLGVDATREQVLFVVGGDGTVSIQDETAQVRKWHTLFVPAGQAAGFVAGPAGLQLVSFGTIIKR